MKTDGRFFMTIGCPFLGLVLGLWINARLAPVPTFISFWVLALAPLTLLVRLTFVSVIIQTLLLLRELMLPFRMVFRTVTIAFYPLLLGSMLRHLWLGANESEWAENIMPLSLAHWAASLGIRDEILMLLNSFNLFEAAWCLIVVRGLRRTGLLSPSQSLRTTLWAWIIFTIGQWTLYLYVQKGF